MRGVFTAYACLFDEVAVDGAMDDTQHQGDEFGVDDEQASQRYRE